MWFDPSKIPHHQPGPAATSAILATNGLIYAQKDQKVAEVAEVADLQNVAHIEDQPCSPDQRSSARAMADIEADKLNALIHAIFATNTAAERSAALLAAFAALDSALTCCRQILAERWGERRCSVWCCNLCGRVCVLVAPDGRVRARRGHEPKRYRPRRCEGCLLLPVDAGTRAGSERWPSLIEQRTS